MKTENTISNSSILGHHKLINAIVVPFKGESLTHDPEITANEAYELLENQTNSASGFSIRVDYPEETVVC